MIDRRRFVSTAASPLLAAIAGTFGPALEALAATEAPIAELRVLLDLLNNKDTYNGKRIIATSVVDRFLAPGAHLGWMQPKDAPATVARRAISARNRAAI